MFSAIVSLLSALAGYLRERERNYRLRTLNDLYSNLGAAQAGLVALVRGNTDPDRASILLATGRVRNLKRLLDEYSDAVPSASGDGGGGPEGPSDPP